MKVFWTEKASKQLDQIFEYIASDSTLYAHRTVGNIIQEAESIMSQPRKGRKVPEYEHEDRRYKGSFSSSISYYLSAKRWGD